MTYEELLMLKKQFEGAKSMYLAAHPEDVNTLDKRLAVDMLSTLTTAKQTVDNYTSLVRAIADELMQRVEVSQKEYLTLDETAKFLGLSKSYLYKLSSKRKIPVYKPMGGQCYFSYEDIINWITQES